MAGIEDGANKYTLPTASATVLGGVKVGANLTITDGVLSADQQKIDLTPYAKSADVATVYETKADATSKQKTLSDSIALKANTADVEKTYETKTDLATTLLNYATNKSLEAYAKKSDIASAVIYKGSVDTFADLPKTGMQIGWMYNIVEKDDANGIRAGDNVVYNGKDWDNQGGTFVIDTATESDIDGLFTTTA